MPTRFHFISYGIVCFVRVADARHDLVSSLFPCRFRTCIRFPQRCASSTLRQMPRKDTKAPAAAGAFAFWPESMISLHSDGFGRLRRCRGSRSILLRVRLADIDAALEKGAIFNADASRGHIAGQRALGPDIHAIARGDVAAHLAQDHDLAGSDAGRHLAVAPYGNAVSGQVDTAVDLAVDIKGLGPGDFTFDHQALADGGLFAG